MNLYDDKNLYQLLEEMEVIPPKKLEGAYKNSQDDGSTLADFLLDKELISEDNLGRTEADLIDVPFVSFEQVGINKEIATQLSQIIAEERRVIPFKRDKDGLHIAMRNPKDLETIEFMKKKFGDPVKVYYVTEKDFEDGMTTYLQDAKEAFSEIIEKTVKEVQTADEPESPVVKLIDTIIDYAHKSKASDIHLEPLEDDAIVRFRIDGKLHDIADLPLNIYPQIVTRIKVLTELRTDEHQEPQDGNFSFALKRTGEELDLRVSVVPVTEGEKVVLRLLSEVSRRLALPDLGLTKEEMKKIEAAYQTPHGMILSTGPTGSGKTTTMYSILKRINTNDVNIMTIEDPVEYNLERVNQIQVNKETGLSFADGLRSIVRQDPDIILVGEIRDNETADIAINSAMSGHLVLSTVHANDAPTTIPRLIDLNVEPFLIASSVNIIVAQRLIRKVCPKCRASVEIPRSKIEKIDKEIAQKYFEGKEKIRVYQGEGCSVCHQTGYSGRIGIFEIMEIDDELQDAIVAKKDAEEIRQIAIKNGMTTMLESGIEKVKHGVTTIDEVLRATKN